MSITKNNHSWGLIDKGPFEEVHRVDNDAPRTLSPADEE